MMMTQEENIRFADDMHKAFFIEYSRKTDPDVYLSSLIYTLGVCRDTRRHFHSIYDTKERCIIPKAIDNPWQTDSSLKVTRLAFQLYTNSTPTAFLGGSSDIDECRRYTVSNIFCCSYAPYFIDAVYLRYPEYLNCYRREKYLFSGNNIG